MKITVMLFLLVATSFYAQDKNISVVSMEKANIIYRNIANHIKVAFPGADSFKVEGPGKLFKVDSIGNYMWYIGSAPCCEAKLEITAFMQNGDTLKESKIYKIEGLGRPYTTIDGKYYKDGGCSLQFSKQDLKNARVGYKFDNYPYDVKGMDGHFGAVHTGKVDGFKIFIEIGDELKEMSVTGDILDGRVKKEIDKLKAGSVVIIGWVSAIGFDKSPQDIVIEITDN